MLALGAAVLPLLGSEHHGIVKFGGLPLPGASVTAKPMNAKEGDKTFSAITDLDGLYSFPDLPDGVWTIQVEMPLFSPMQQEVTVGAGAAAADWDLKLLPAQQISAIVTPAPRLQVAETPAPAAAPVETGSQREGCASRAHQHRHGISAHGPERSALRTTTIPPRPPTRLLRKPAR